MKLLFVCTANVQRSVTAENLFSDCSGFETRSAGTDAAEGRTKLSQQLIDWADIIFAMSEAEDKHISFISKNFQVGERPVYDLGISDKYYTDDPVLQRLLIEKISKHLDLKPHVDSLLKKLTPPTREF